MTTDNDDPIEQHFLVVDDDPESRSTIVEYLKAMGYKRITQAVDGQQAMVEIEKDPSINFVISDWDMPTMDGFGLLQRIKLDPNRAQTPFLIVTSPVSEEAEKVVLAAENLVDAYLIKPFRGHMLKEKIEKALTSKIRGPQKEVVVIDDDNDAREMVVEYLKKMGFREVTYFSDAKSALKYLEEKYEGVGLIVSDWVMPEMSGIELLRACKANPVLKELPFLMITSQSSIERMKVMQAAKANVDQYLLKPFTGEDLKKRVEGLLDKNRWKNEIQILVAEGLEHLERGRYTRAQSKFEEVLKLDAIHDLALRGMGDAIIKTKGVESALPYYKRAVESNPLNPRGYIKLANAYEQIGWIDKAISLLQTANQQINFSGELHFQLGRLYNKKGMHELAKMEFEKTLEIQLDHQEARLMLEMLNSRRNG